MPFNNYMMEENKPVITACETLTTSATESFVSENHSMVPPSGMDNVFSPLAPAFRPRGDVAMMPEPRIGDVAPSGPQIDEDMLMNLRSNSDMLFDVVDHNSNNNYFMGNALGGGQRAESVSSNVWGDGSSNSVTSARHDDAIETLDFLAKSISSANSYVSMLTREQLAVLRAFRPSLLYEFLQEIAKLRSDKRLRRAAPNECAFCKNNGENEECYSSHSLKDWRGRVLCPVLRAFRCPRCGATGDRAHTIKYCPEQSDNGVDRSGSFSRRRMSSSSLLFPQQQQRSAPTPSASPAPTSPSFAHLQGSNLWNPFNFN